MMGCPHPRIMGQIAKQARDLAQNPSEGVTFEVSPDDILDLGADIGGPVSTPYEGGIFRCNLQIPSDFPNSPPKGYFLTKIFHPNVSLKGEICVSLLKDDWAPVHWSLRQIFEVIRCLLINPWPDSALNEEAGKMIYENYDQYVTMAKMYTNLYAIPKGSAKPSRLKDPPSIFPSEMLKISPKRGHQENERERSPCRFEGELGMEPLADNNAKYLNGSRKTEALGKLRGVDSKSKGKQSETKKWQHRAFSNKFKKM